MFAGKWRDVIFAERNIYELNEMVIRLILLDVYVSRGVFIFPIYEFHLKTVPKLY